MRIGLRSSSVTLLAAIVLVGSPVPAAGQGTLWLGNDHHPPAVHVRTDGTLINSLSENITGFTYDGVFLYSAPADSMQLTRRNPADGSEAQVLSINPGMCASVCEDMAFDGVSIWRIEHHNTTIHRLDRLAGAIIESIPLTIEDPEGTLDPLGGYGIAWDGTQLWLSFGPQDGVCELDRCGVVMTYDVAGGTLTFKFSTEFVPGGLDFDTDGNLWVGGYGNELHVLTTSGTVVDTIAVPDGSGGFSDGLEFIEESVEPMPDLLVIAISDPPGGAVLGAKFPVTDTTFNQGGASAGTTSTRYYLSLDTTRSGSDKALGGIRKVPALDVGDSSSGTKTVRVPASAKPGTYFLLACADATTTVAESDETNNCAASVTTVVVRAPDLVETALGAPPASAPRGGSFAVSDTVQNVGDAAAGSSTTRYYLSLDTKKSATDVMLTGSRAVPGLGVGAISAGAVSVTVPLAAPTGARFLLACADDLKKVAEGNEKNNCRASATTVNVN